MWVQLLIGVLLVLGPFIGAALGAIALTYLPIRQSEALEPRKLRR